jgi:hypothetical protein
MHDETIHVVAERHWATRAAVILHHVIVAAAVAACALLVLR